jgi:hypothetical protein
MLEAKRLQRGTWHGTRSRRREPGGRSSTTAYATHQALRHIPESVLRILLGHTPRTRVTQEHYIHIDEQAKQAHRRTGEAGSDFRIAGLEEKFFRPLTGVRKPKPVGSTICAETELSEGGPRTKCPITWHQVGTRRQFPRMEQTEKKKNMYNSKRIDGGHGWD